jgi:hypothetical protein
MLTITTECTCWIWKTFLQIFHLVRHTPEHRRPLRLVTLPYYIPVRQGYLTLPVYSSWIVPYWTLVHGHVWSMTILRLETHVQFGIQLCGSVSYSLPPHLGGFKAQSRATDAFNYKQDQRSSQTSVARSPERSNSVRCSVQLQCCNTKRL